MKFQWFLVFAFIAVFSACSNTEKTKIKADIIVTNATIVTSDSNNTIIHNGTIVIKNSRIIDIGNFAAINNKYYSSDKIDATGKLIIPGLINTHTHAAMSLFRGVIDDIPLKEWLLKYIFPLEEKSVDSDFVITGTKLAIAEMLHSGTTTFNDMYFFENQVAEVSKSAGIRVFINESIKDGKTPDAENADEGLLISENLITKWKKDSFVRVSVSVHSPYTCSGKNLVRAKQLSDKYSLNFNIHLSETRWELDTIKKSFNLTPVQYLDKLGILSNNVIAAHCVHLTNEDIMILADKNVGVAHNPESNLKLASGVAPVPEMQKKGVTVGLATDGCVSNNVLNMFSAMRVTAQIHKVYNNDPTVMNSVAVFRLATIDAAKILGIDNEIGSIEIGKKADLVIINLDSPHMTPLYNIYSQIVYCMNGSEVETVIINGKIIMKNNKILTFDEKKVISEANDFAVKIKKLINN
jgi:5-methylthioadenosine/S-adenosylhomocysteine deaminase